MLYRSYFYPPLPPPLAASLAPRRTGFRNSGIGTNDLPWVVQDSFPGEQIAQLGVADPSHRPTAISILVWKTPHLNSWIVRSLQLS